MSSRLTLAANALSFRLLADRGDLDRVDELSGRTRATAMTKAAQLIDRDECLLHLRFGRDAGVVGVAEDRPADLVAPAGVPQVADADEGVAVSSSSRFGWRSKSRSWRRPTAPPQVLVRAAEPGEVAHRGGDGLAVLAEALGGDPFVEQLSGLSVKSPILGGSSWSRSPACHLSRRWSTSQDATVGS
jgi:hypothetical protein